MEPVPVPQESAIIHVIQIYKIPLGMGLIGISLILVAGFLLIKSRQTAQPIDFVLGEATQSGEFKRRTIKIDIAGAVEKPGVYVLEEGDRVEDAISAAGGFNHDVSQTIVEKSLNLAQRLGDGMKLYIPSVNDERTSQNNLLDGVSTSHNITSGQMGSVVSINNASEQSLETLFGVGPSTAAKIIAGRPYVSLDELVSKKAIGAKLYDKIKSQLTL